MYIVTVLKPDVQTFVLRES